MKRVVFLSLLVLTLSFGTAQAIDVQNFQPAMGPHNLLSLYTSDPLSMGQFALGAVGNYAYGPLRLEYDNGEELDVVERLITGHGYAAVGLFDIFDLMVGGNFNSVYGSDLDAIAIEGFGESEDTSGMSPGDVQFGAKARLLKNTPEFFGLAIAAFGSAPTGDEDLYVGAGALNFGGSLIVDKRFDIVNIVLNAGYRYMGGTDDLDPAGQINGGLGLDVAINKWFGLTGEFIGRTVDYDIEGIDAATPLEALVGTRFFTPIGFNFFLAGGFGLTDGIGSPVYRGMAGVSFTYPKLEYGVSARTVAPPPDPRFTDSDRDGLTDFLEENTYGTDPNNPDSDGDGLRDGDEVNEYKTDPNKADSDGDGLNDGNEIRLFSTDPNNPDTDGDTLPDGQEVNDLRTNPLSADSDNDNVPDNLDGAPLEPETVNGYMDDDGVPEVVLARKPSGVMMLENQIVLPAPLTFGGPQGSRLTRTDKSLLDDVARILQEYPKVKIRIEGHVAAGTPDAMQLTQKRAEAVMRHLSRRRVAANRMTSAGMGDQVPISSNDTAAGRAANNRIDFIITEQ